MPQYKSSLVALAIVAAALLAGPARAASTPDEFCSGNPCVVTGTITANAGSVVNFGGRSLVIASGAQINIGSGAVPRILKLIAGDITMQPGAQIRGFAEDRAEVTLEATSGAVTLQSIGTNRAEINVKSAEFEAGNILIRAATDAIIGGRLTASASGLDATGGSIEIEAGGNVSITEECTTQGIGSFGGAGDFLVTADGDISISNKVFADGSDFGGGNVWISSAGGNVTISALITNSGGNPDGEAGEFDIQATSGTVTIAAGGELRGKGGAGADDDCGDGATTFITSGGTTTIAGLLALSGGYQCFGGEVEVSAGLDFLMTGSGKIDTSTGGGFGAGGPTRISANRNASLLQIDCSSAGFGGDIDVNAGLSLDVLGKLGAQASGSFGIGARIRLASCAVNVLAPAGELDSRGPLVFSDFGVNEIRVSGIGVVSGKMQAANKNEIRYRTVIPTVTGTTSPAVVLTEDPSLLECVNSCGDGNVDPSEACDDGNLLSCDGCSSDCLRPDHVCGDGVLECGEQCDDGNPTPGDGCENNCTPTGQEETGVYIAGRGARVGCQAEWLVRVDQPNTDKKGKPLWKQTCIDGDFGCDADGQINDSCSFLVSPCVNVPDPDLPECDPTSRVERIVMKRPLPNASRGVDASNANKMLASLKTIGAKLEAEGAVLQAGGPVSGTSVCGPPFEAVVPLMGVSSRRTLKVRADNEAGRTLEKAQVQLKCARNKSVCGNSVVEPGETCDDGNAQSCDGCSNCRTEFCGNGAIECSEQCDDGFLNGSPDSRCSPRCAILPTSLRIPGGGSGKTDCMLQWSVDIGADDLIVDKRGMARNKLTCIDGDPGCDTGQTPGVCRMRVFACLGAENPAIGCSAHAVDRVEVKRPGENARADFEKTARAKLQRALGELALPSDAGVELCTNAMEFDIPKGGKLRLAAKAVNGQTDGDSLRLLCD